MRVITSDYIVYKEAIREVDSLFRGAAEAITEKASSIKNAFGEFSIKVGNTKLVDKRILPTTTQEFLSRYDTRLNLTNLHNTISINEFMQISGISELQFLPSSMIVYSRSGEKFPVFVRLSSEMMQLIKKGKQFNFLGYRAIGIKYNKKKMDEYFDKIIGIENPETNRIYYFGVW